MSKAIEIVYNNGVSVVGLDDGRNLTSSIVPALGFEFDELMYTNNTKTFTLNDETFQLNDSQKLEVINFLDTVTENKEATAQLQLNYDSQKYLNDTDWIVLRHLREKTLNKPTTLTDEAFIDLEQKRDDVANQVVKID